MLTVLSNRTKLHHLFYEWNLKTIILTINMNCVLVMQHYHVCKRFESMIGQPIVNKLIIEKGTCRNLNVTHVLNYHLLKSHLLDYIYTNYAMLNLIYILNC